MNNKAEELMRKYHYGFKHSNDLLEDEYVKDLNKEIERLNNIIDELEKYLEEEQIRLARECSNIYEDSLGKTKLVNEITRIKDKLKELKEGK